MSSSRLFTPGPTDVPQRIREVMSKPLIHHRTEAFRNALEEVTTDLQYVMQTENPVIVLAASGTGAMEAALVNVTKPGEKVLITSSGKFGFRWKELADCYDLESLVVETKWGEPARPEQVKSALEAKGPVDVIFTTHAETSTGVLQDVAGIAEVGRSFGTVVVVDAIASLCAQEVKADAWGVDVIVGGSQKGFGVPPGLSFVSLSEKARERVQKKGFPCYYFDLSKALKSLQTWDTAFTPATMLVMAMRTSLKMIREEGLENVIHRHERNAMAVRTAVKALDLELFASTPCNATTAVLPREGSAGDIMRIMESHYGVKIAGGQAHLSGKIFRLGHLGFYSEVDIYTLVSALEGTLEELGLNPSPGRGMEGAIENFQTTRSG